MSAIAGLVHLHDQPVSPEEGASLMHALQSYPADRVHHLCTEQVFFGCHAQWLTPEAVNEQLPLVWRERQLFLTADVILDNREELCDELQVERVRRRDVGDGELILLAYDKWGRNAPNYLIGEFAFLIWDEREHVLFGARDQTGSRTLYFHFDRGRFAFCTALQPLFSLSGLEKRLNEQWMAEFLSIPGMMESTDVFATAYEQVNQLPPAHAIVVHSDRVACTRYSRLVPDETLRLSSNEEYEEAFRAVFQKAVQAKIRTHKQVGVTLSGGLDSGAVASFAAKTLFAAGQPLHAYSSIPVHGFADWTNARMLADERPFIRETVRHIGNVEARYLDFAGRSPFTEIDEWLQILGIPYKYFENSHWVRGIFEQAREDQVGILLTGAWGNFTISWGPAIDYYTQLFKRLRWLSLYQELRLYSSRKKVKRSRLLSMIARKALPVLDRNASGQLPVHALANPALADKYDVMTSIREHELHGEASLDAFDVRLRKFNSLATASKNGIMSTQLSLRYGLRERDPSGDPRVIRFCLSVPVEQYVQQGMDRSLIRRATKGWLPDKVRLNQTIRGVQGVDWVQRMLPHWPQFIHEIRQLLKDDRAAYFMNMDGIQKALEPFIDTPRPDLASHPDLRLLMRSLVVYRFLTQVT